MNVIIRKAKDVELKTVQKLNHQLFLHDEEFDLFLNMNWPFEKDGKDYFRDKINGKKGVCFVAEVDGEIVGYLAGGLTQTHPYRIVKRMAELENILVKEELRGQRIGEKLFEKFVDWSKSMEAERIKVSAYVGNFKAIKFYERIGFVPYDVDLEYKVK